MRTKSLLGQTELTILNQTAAKLKALGYHQWAESARATAAAAQTAIHKEQGPTPAGIPTWVWLAGGAVALGGAYLLLKKR